MIAAATIALLAAAPAPDEWHALIIGNNASPTQQRSPLDFADDDAIRFALTLDAVVPAERRLVLTRIDDDTSRFEALGVTVTASPTGAAIEAAFETLRARFVEARRAGRTVGLFVFFGGHGDVEGGEGFLELEDGRLTGRQLERQLTSLGTAEVHVVLDSCNSFFVMSPRKPGGKRFATPTDLATSLGARLPNVGVVLSTSADAESWEWSELQAGVFSHLVRSGLAGPADLNGDDAISYAELRQFIAVATKDVKNPRLRPQVFARGPGGDDSRLFVRLTREGTRGITSESTAPRRITIRDTEGTRWLDAHAAAGQRLVIRVPNALASWLRIEVIGVAGQLLMPEREQSLEALERAPPLAVARGPRGLEALFTTPFGTTAVDALPKEESDSFGVTDAEWARLVSVVDRLGTIEQNDRLRGLMLGSVWTLGFLGAAAIAHSTQALPDSACRGWCDMRAGWLSFVGLAGLGAFVTSAQYLGSYRAQVAIQTVAEQTQGPRNRQRSAARIEGLFLKELTDRRWAIKLGAVVSGLLLAAYAGLMVLDPVLSAVNGSALDLQLLLTNLAQAGFMASALINDLFRSDEREQLMQQWLDGSPSGVPPVRLGVRFMPGGGGLTLSVALP